MSEEYQLTPHKYLSEAEYQDTLKRLEHFQNAFPRDTLMLQLMLFTGARPSELLSVRLKDFNAKTGSIFLTGIKGSRDRTIPIPKWLSSRLLTYVTELMIEPIERIFPLSRVYFTKIWRDFRPKDSTKSLRCTRHTFGLRAYQKTKDARLVQKMLGHRRLQTTEIYLDYTYTEQEFRKALL